MWKKGFYDVVVAEDGQLTARYVESDHRSFHRLSFGVDSYESPADLFRALRDALRQHAPEWRNDNYKPVVEVSLEGMLEFDRSDLDLMQIQQAVEEELAPLVVRVSFSRDFKLRGIDVVLDEALSPAELERSVLREVVLSDSRYASHADTWAEIMLEIKSLALKRKNPETIIQTLETRLDEIVEEV